MDQMLKATSNKLLHQLSKLELILIT